MSGQLEVVQDNSDLVLHEISTAIGKALEEIGSVAEGHAIGYETAVDTGRLRNSITHVVDSGGKFVAIGTNVEYAPYIELGHHSYKGIAFLRKAATNHAKEYREILEEEMQNA